MWFTSSPGAGVVTLERCGCGGVCPESGCLSSDGSFAGFPPQVECSRCGWADQLDAAGAAVPSVLPCPHCGAECTVR